MRPLNLTYEMEEWSSFHRLTSKMSRIVETELNSANKRIQTRIKGLKAFDTSNMKHVMDFFSEIEDEFNSAKKSIQNRMMEMDKGSSRDSAVKQLKLQFVNKISPIIFPGDEIKGEEGASLEVALIDASTGELVKVGPEASVMVDIVLLKGDPDASEGDDWTTEEFEEKIVRDMEGKVSLIVGNTRVKLQGGIGRMESIKLRHRAKKMNPPLFHLGAIVVDTVDNDRVKEAKTQPFTVGNYRKKYSKKHETPSLADEVFRLVNICRGGNIEIRLKDDGISTVEDFLIRLLIDPEGLKSMVRMPPKKWSDTVTNARACRDKRMYCYTDFQHKTTVTFNIHGEVLGLHVGNQCNPTNIFSENHEAQVREMLASARRNWEAVKAFDDGNSLQEYLSCLREDCKRLRLLSGSSQPCNLVDDFWFPGLVDPFPSLGLVNTNTSVRIGESSRRSNFSVQSLSPALNSGTGTDLDDLTDFSIDDVEIAEPLFLTRSPECSIDWAAYLRCPF